MTAIPLIGQTVTTTKVNLRQGAASTRAPVLRKLEAGTTVPVQALVVGEAVEGNAHWFLTDQQGFVWSGGCGPFVPAATSAAIGPTAAVAPSVVDIFHGDLVTSFAQARAAGVLGIIHKATTGQSGKDETYESRRKDAQAAGLLWGAYHFGTAAPVDKQIENFLNTAKPDENTLVALDFEPDLGNQMTLEGAREFLQGIMDKLDRRAVIYSGDTLKSALANTKDDFFGAHRLWLAQYSDHPKIQPSWNTYWLWQYTDGDNGPDPKRVPGISGDSQGRLDCNHFMGTDSQLREQWAS